MPTYDYACNKCSSTWEEQLPMAEIEKPLSLPCPHCNESGNVIREMGAPLIGDAFRLGKVKPPSQLSERIKQIHANKKQDIKGSFTNTNLTAI